MKLITVIIAILIHIPIAFAQDSEKISAEERYFRQACFRSWTYGEILLKTIAEPERVTLEIDLAAAAFDYFILLENGEIKRNLGIDRHIKRIMEGGLIRKAIIDDPLNRTALKGCGNPRGTSSKKIIKDEDYEILKQKFISFIKSVKTD